MVVPELFPVNTLLKLVPSVETDIIKLYCLEAPSAQAMSTLQTDFCTPKSTCIQGLTMNVEYHLVLKLLSMALVGGNEF